MARRAARLAAAAAAVAAAPELRDPGHHTPAPAPPPPLTPPFSRLEVPHPDRFRAFLDLNKAAASRMPLSYNPAGYFAAVPAGLRQSGSPANGTFVEACARSNSTMAGRPPGTVNATMMDAYAFQTEANVAAVGTDIYAGALWSVAQAALGNTADPQYYTKYIIWASRTLQLPNIRAADFCKGLMAPAGVCTDPARRGVCGVCYGDNATAVPRSHALLLRTVSDYSSLDGTHDARCPDAGAPWAWNEYKPVVGDNAWASLIAPLTVALRVYGSPAAIPEGSPEFQAAIAIVPALLALRCGAPPGAPGHGALYFAPHNAFAGGANPAVGATASVAHNAAAYAGLRGLQWVLSHHPAYERTRCEVAGLLAGLESFLLSAFEDTFFHQSGQYDRARGEWTWGSGGALELSVDAQTWTVAALGPAKVDGAFGPQTTYKLWTALKRAAGYGAMANGTVRGFGHGAAPPRGAPTNDSADVSPQLDVYVTTPSAAFDRAAFLDRVSYDVGVPASSIRVISSAGDGAGGTRVAVAFTTVGDAPALYTAKRFAAFCNSPRSQEYRYAHCARAAFAEALSAGSTLAAINMARVVANQSAYPAAAVAELVADADAMRRGVDAELNVWAVVQQDCPAPYPYGRHPALLESNVRYEVPRALSRVPRPFGWWVNPIQSTAATGWAVATDLGWNPLMLDGAYAVEYDRPPAVCAGAPPAPPPQLPFPAPSEVPFPPDPHHVLRELFDVTGGATWTRNGGSTAGGCGDCGKWFSTYNPCGSRLVADMVPWDGVSCDYDGRVVGIDLQNNNLVGTLPASIGTLTHLVSVNFQANKLTGTIPAAWGNLTRMYELQLSQNALSGELPASLGKAMSLQYFWAYQNQLTGSIPAEWRSLERLVVLDMHVNQLALLPDDLPWGQYTNCDLSANMFTCPIPQSAQTDCYARCAGTAPPTPAPTPAPPPPPPPAPRRVCLHNAAASQQALQNGVNYACDPSGGGVDCAAVNTGGACFEPDTLAAHADYIFDKYYQANPVSQSCDFGGAAALSTCSTAPTKCDPCPASGAGGIA